MARNAPTGATRATGIRAQAYHGMRGREATGGLPAAVLLGAPPIGGVGTAATNPSEVVRTVEPVPCLDEPSPRTGCPTSTSIVSRFLVASYSFAAVAGSS